MLVALFKKWIMTLKLQKLKKNLLIIIMINILQLQNFNKLATDVFNARLAQANLIIKTDFDAKLSSLNKKITQNKSKHLLVENELNKLKNFIRAILLVRVILKKMVHKII